jgi:hypothetical protein
MLRKVGSLFKAWDASHCHIELTVYPSDLHLGAPG